MTRIRCVDSITQITTADIGCIAVTGSHGGRYSGHFARNIGVSGAVFNDAGFGKNSAGVQGLVLLGEVGIPAVAVSVLTAIIGSADATIQTGIVSAVNTAASGLGVEVGEECASALRKLEHSNADLATTTLPEENREIQDFHGYRLVLADSHSLMLAEDVGSIFICGSHGSVPGGDSSRVLKYPAAFAAFNDATGGKNDAGYSRIFLLDKQNIPAVTVDANSAEIGSGAETFNFGRVSKVNETARQLGITLGHSLKAQLKNLVEEFSYSLDEKKWK